MAAPVFRMGCVMAIPPDLDVNILRQRVDGMSTEIAELRAERERDRAEITELRARIRTIEVVRHVDLVLDQKSGGA